MSTLRLTWGKTVHDFIRAVVRGEGREYMLVGTRGEGKTHGVLGAMVAHAERHRAEGYPWPTRWLGVTDKFTNHENKTLWSIRDPLWQGVWREEKSGHAIGAWVGGRKAVQVELFGVPDLSEVDKVRTECHGVWFEEPAPTALMGDSAGLDERTWLNALTSQRLPTYHYPAVMTLNYPEEEHWTWRRFRPSTEALEGFPARGEPDWEVRQAAWYQAYGRLTQGTHPDYPARRWFRVPPGERADAAQRAAWAEALREYPDLLRRLVEGRPGVIVQGVAVAEAFRESVHVARRRLEPVVGEPVALGVDFGLTPCVVVGQVVRGERRVLGAFPCGRGGIAQHWEQTVGPWFAARVPWAVGRPEMVYGVYDPAGETPEQTDSERSPVQVLEERCPGRWMPGPTDWWARLHTLRQALMAHVAPGQAALQIDPMDAEPLVRALGGRWYYATDRTGQVRRDLPKKPNHPWEDLGDALIYWLWAVQGGGPRREVPRVQVELAFAFD